MAGKKLTSKTMAALINLDGSMTIYQAPWELTDVEIFTPNFAIRSPIYVKLRFAGTYITPRQ